MSGPLVDNEGFPLANVDLHGVRIMRSSVIRLQNDHKDAMKCVHMTSHQRVDQWLRLKVITFFNKPLSRQIEAGLQTLHSLSKQAQPIATPVSPSQPSQSLDTASLTPKAASPTPQHTAPDTASPSQPCLRISEVALDSPAATAVRDACR